jgi:hypothetical protein
MSAPLSSSWSSLTEARAPVRFVPPVHEVGWHFFEKV